MSDTIYLTAQIALNISDVNGWWNLTDPWTGRYLGAISQQAKEKIYHLLQDEERIREFSNAE